MNTEILNTGAASTDEAGTFKPINYQNLKKNLMVLEVYEVYPENPY